MNVTAPFETTEQVGLGSVFVQVGEPAVVVGAVDEEEDEEEEDEEEDEEEEDGDGVAVNVTVMVAGDVG